MPPSLPDLAAWDALSTDECDTIARDLVTALPTGTTFDRVEPHSLGGQSRHVAFFLFEDERFALIPGGPVELGYDRTRPYPFSAAMLENWETETREEYGLPESFEEVLDAMLTPSRSITLKPFLISVMPREYDFKPYNGTISVKTTTKFRGDNQLDGVWRIPTADEWEHACAAGTRTLFRWGNECPTDETSDETRTFTAHKGSNGFGLTFNASTYDIELCDGGITRGGDGGSTVCGGLGTVATWLPFASAYQDPPDVVAEWYCETVFIRRVFEITER
jgi:hypothetical protein